MHGTQELRVTIEGPDGHSDRVIGIRRLIIAGWTGRDPAAMEEHIAELEALGVKRPPRTPMFYHVSSSRLTTHGEIEVPGRDSTGEVEFVLLRADGATYVGCGSDHTDRKVESYDVQVSKQLCDKPIASTLWPLDAVYPHWEQLTLSSHACIDGERVAYQDGPVTGMRDPHDLLSLLESEEGTVADGTVMFCGTLPALGGVRFAERFEYTLTDPVTRKRIASGYDVCPLPTAD